MVLPPTSHICLICRPVREPAPGRIFTPVLLSGNWSALGRRRLMPEADRPDVRVGDGPDLRVRTHEALERQRELTGQAVVVAHVDGVIGPSVAWMGAKLRERMAVFALQVWPPSTETAQKRSIMKLAGSRRRS